MIWYIIRTLEQRGFFIWPLRFAPSILLAVLAARLVYLSNGPAIEQWIISGFWGSVFLCIHSCTHWLIAEGLVPMISWWWAGVVDDAHILAASERRMIECQEKQPKQSGGDQPT